MNIFNFAACNQPNWVMIKHDCCETIDAKSSSLKLMAASQLTLAATNS